MRLLQFYKIHRESINFFLKTSCETGALMLCDNGQNRCFLGKNSRLMLWEYTSKFRNDDLFGKRQHYKPKEFNLQKNTQFNVNLVTKMTQI